MRSTFYVIMLFTLLLGYSITGFAASSVRDEFKVTEVFLKADDGRPTGPCPVRVVFRGYITANGPGAIKYTFTRSDGATGPVYIMEFKKAGTQPVMTDWTLGDSRVLPRYAGWQAVKVLSPVEIESNHDTGSFEINCTGTFGVQTNPEGESAWPSSEGQYWRSTYPIPFGPHQTARLELKNTGNKPISVRIQFVDKDGKVLIEHEQNMVPHGWFGFLAFDGVTGERSNPSGPHAGDLNKTTIPSTQQGFPTGFRVRVGTTEARSLLLIQPTLQIFEKGRADPILRVEPNGFTKAALGPPVVQP
jgi:hypothetical protein